MTPERWEKIRQLFHAALDHNLAGSGSQREAFLREACPDDELMRREVDSLLEHEHSAESFLGAPPGVSTSALMTEALQSLVGHQIGSYRILSRLGSGGMGEVYRARDSKLGRDVAIKVMPHIFVNDAERRARFEREARLLAALNHPNIGAIYGLEEAGDAGHGLVLELVEGPTLADRLRTGALPMTEALTVARQIADALEAAHEKGIVHRDLKPANIKIAPDGLIKVLDFGLAKARADDVLGKEAGAQAVTEAGTRDGIILGTVAYMSPEQARGRPLDKRMDIWAFGCVLYELLSGRMAFPGETLSDTIAAILGQEPDWSALPARTPANVRRLLRRCLEKDPKRRIRDIGDARLEIDDALSGASETAPVPRMKGGRLAWSVVATFAVALVAATFALGRALVLASHPDEAPLFARVIRFTSGPAQDFGPAISPDGKWVAYLSNARGPTDVWVKFVAGGEARNLTASTNLELIGANEIGGLAISPDGANIAFDAGATKGTPAPLFDSWVIPAPLGGLPRKLVQLGRAVRWSPDGAKIAYVRAGASSGDALFVADADAGNPREIVGVKGGIHVHYPAWSADGRYVYFIYSISGLNSEPSEIYRVPASGGAMEPVIATARRAIFPIPTPDGLGLIYAANPLSAELGLWWKSLNHRHEEPRRITTGIGEYAEPSISADGRNLVATLIEYRQLLSSISVDPADEGRSHPLTDGYSGDLDPSLSADGERLVFSSTRSGNRNIWKARPDGTEPRPLTSGTAIDERPAFSPDGQRIAFVSDRGGQRGIWVMDADGGAARLVVKAQVLDTLAWSPDNRQVVYATPIGDAPGLWIASIDDGSVRRLPTPGPAVAPAWSPRGDAIAYLEARRSNSTTANSTALALVAPSGEPLFTQSPQDAKVPNGFLAWAADGRRVAALANPGGTPSVVWIVDLEGRQGSRQLIQFPVGVRLRGATWSRDGSSLIVGQTSRTSDIVLFERGR